MITDLSGLMPFDQIDYVDMKIKELFLYLMFDFMIYDLNKRINQ